MRTGTQLCQHDSVSRFPPPPNIDFFPPFLLKSLKRFLLLRAAGSAGNCLTWHLRWALCDWYTCTSLCITSFLVLNVSCFLSLSTVPTLWLECTCLPLCKLILQIFGGELWFNLSALCGAFSENNFLLLFQSCAHTNKAAMTHWFGTLIWSWHSVLHFSNVGTYGNLQ